MDRNDKGLFAKGNKYGKGCRPQMPADIRAARNMSYEDMCKTVIEVRKLTSKGVKELDMENTPLGMRAIINAYAKLDYQGIKIYEDRLWGKAQESIDLGIDATGNIEIIISAKQIEDNNDIIVIPNDDNNESKN